MATPPNGTTGNTSHCQIPFGIRTRVVSWGGRADLPAAGCAQLRAAGIRHGRRARIKRKRTGEAAVRCWRDAPLVRRALDRASWEARTMNRSTFVTGLRTVRLARARLAEHARADRPDAAC